MKKIFYLKHNGFTLIELIVVMAVIGILVLISTPKVLGITDRAKETKLKTDIKVVENAVSEELLESNGQLPFSWKGVSIDELKLLASDGKVVGFDGKSNIIEEEDYKKVPEAFITKSAKLKIEGNFYANNNGKVYFISSKHSEGLSESDFKFDRKPTIINDETKLKVLKYSLPNGIFKAGNKVLGIVEVKGVQSGNYDIVMTLEHSKAFITVESTKNFDILQNETKTINLEYLVTIANRLGFYNSKISIKQGETVVAEYSIIQSVSISSNEWEYFYQDDFTGVDFPEFGGIGGLSPSKVALTYVDGSPDYGKAVISIHANDKMTGQIKSNLPITYGTYEARMKVPNSDAMLNSFFLYGDNPDNPEVTYEIDMEVLKQDGKWQLWTTIHNVSNDSYTGENGLQPGEMFQEKIDLAVDPSAAFYNYRIDFYDDYVAFVFDGLEVSRWHGRFDYGDMRIYSGTFYTHWLSKNYLTQDAEMVVEWIRRKYEQ